MASRPLRGDEMLACAHRVALSRGGPFAFAPPGDSDEALRRRRGAEEWREKVLELLASAHPEAARPTSREDTIKHLDSGTLLVLSPLLPDDVEGRRRSRVQALVRVGRRESRHTYAPLLIKNIEVVEAAQTRRTLQTNLEELVPSRATFHDALGVRTTRSVTRSGITLAHATRVLGALGYADSQARAGLIDRHARVFWLNLSGRDYPRFNLETYDDLYEKKLAILLGHDRWERDEGEFPTAPYWHRECLECPYAAQCREDLEAHDDVSLTRFTNATQQLLMREHGVNTRSALARLDPSRARAARRALPGDTTTEVALGRSIENLDELIYRARAHTHSGPLRIVAPLEVGCPRADVEVDVDMESYADHTYLWGAFVSTRAPVTGITDGYRHFESWHELSSLSETEIFSQFWTWFDALRQTCANQGLSFAAYCFWAQAEDGAMDRAVLVPLPGGPSAQDLHDFRDTSPSQWIDMHALVKAQIQTEGPLGLKSLATHAGFSWRDPSPSGEASMSWFEVARGEGEEAIAQRRRLLEYNEDDCRATRALRDWLDGPARNLTHRDDHTFLTPDQ